MCPDGIFCPAEVLEIEKKVRLGGQQHERDDDNNNDDGDDNRLELKDIISVKIHYVGWENEWDESVTNLCRIRPGWTYTYKCRAWVRLSDKFCHWPCVLFVRRPYRKAAISHLKAENKMYIMPCGKNEKPIVPFKPGMWFKAKSITSFEKGYQVKVEEGRNDKRYGSHFISAVQELVSMDDVLPYPFSFIGTYEVGESKKRLEKRVKHVHVGNDQKRHVSYPTPPCDNDAQLQNSNLTDFYLSKFPGSSKEASKSYLRSIPYRFIRFSTIRSTIQEPFIMRNIVKKI